MRQLLSWYGLDIKLVLAGTNRQYEHWRIHSGYPVGKDRAIYVESRQQTCGVRKCVVLLVGTWYKDKYKIYLDLLDQRFSFITEDVFSTIMTPVEWNQFTMTPEFNAWTAYCQVFSSSSRHKDKFVIASSGVLAMQIGSRIAVTLSCSGRDISLTMAQGDPVDFEVARFYHFDYADPDSVDKIDQLIDEYLVSKRQ